MCQHQIEKLSSDWVGGCVPKSQKIEFYQIEAGYEFPRATYEIDSSMISAYLKAVEETSNLCQKTELVPPMVIAARALATLSEHISLPPGTIHVSQKLEFIDTIKDMISS